MGLLLPQQRAPRPPLTVEIPLPAPHGREMQRLPHVFVGCKTVVLSPSASPPNQGYGDCHLLRPPPLQECSDEAHGPGRLPSHQQLNIKGWTPLTETLSLGAGGHCKDLPRPLYQVGKEQLCTQCFPPATEQGLHWSGP